tara:strand:- start:2926 stop:3222 length:297 start_codon:yes stop_codon:yes gene_type:complete
MQEEHSLVFKVDHLRKFRELLSQGRVEEAIKKTKATIEKEIVEVSENRFECTIGITDDTNIEEMMVCLHPYETGFDLLRPPKIRDLEKERLLEEALAV